MGFTDAEVEDLLDQGLLSAARPVTWRPETLADLNWLVSKSRQYDAEEARLTEQFERRKKALAQRRKWLSRYDDDCAAIVADALPKKADGTYKRKSLDLEDGRVKLVQRGGGLVVDEDKFLPYAKRLFQEAIACEDDYLLFSAVRAVRKLTTYEGAAMVNLITEPETWMAEVVKTPLADYLAAHPDADLPGVSEAPVTQVFAIEKGGAL